MGDFRHRLPVAGRRGRWWPGNEGRGVYEAPVSYVRGRGLVARFREELFCPTGSPALRAVGMDLRHVRLAEQYRAALHSVMASGRSLLRRSVTVPEGVCLWRDPLFPWVAQEHVLDAVVQRCFLDPEEAIPPESLPDAMMEALGHQAYVSSQEAVVGCSTLGAAAKLCYLSRISQSDLVYASYRFAYDNNPPGAPPPCPPDGSISWLVDCIIESALGRGLARPEVEQVDRALRKMSDTDACSVYELALSRGNTDVARLLQGRIAALPMFGCLGTTRALLQRCMGAEAILAELVVEGFRTAPPLSLAAPARPCKYSSATRQADLSAEALDAPCPTPIGTSPGSQEASVRNTGALS
jgi:hypothetical protein